MISVFDLEKLQDLLRDFYEIIRIRITVFDENRRELVSYPEEGWAAVEKRCGHLPLDPALLERTCKKQPLISRRYVQSAHFGDCRHVRLRRLQLFYQRFQTGSRPIAGGLPGKCAAAISGSPEKRTEPLQRRPLLREDV